MDGPNSVCRDEFEISNLVNGNFRIPTICGYNTGEHSKLFIYFYSSQLLVWDFRQQKKTSRFQFSVPGLREIHRNLKQQKKFNSRDGFFRKSPFCTFSCMNPGFCGPWDML